jgi:hypothetical protein
MENKNDDWLFYVVILNSIWIMVFTLSNGGHARIDIFGGLMDMVYSIRFNLLFFFAFTGIILLFGKFFIGHTIVLTIIGFFAITFLMMSYNFCFQCIYSDIIGLVQPIIGN